MNKWKWDGGWKAHLANPDGTTTEKTFTSSASARQFVEQQTGENLAPKRVRRHQPKRKRNRKSGRNSAPITELSEAQRRLKDQAMTRFIEKKV